jgi:hypothetical protein
MSFDAGSRQFVVQTKALAGCFVGEDCLPTRRGRFGLQVLDHRPASFPSVPNHNRPRGIAPASHPQQNRSIVQITAHHDTLSHGQ